MITFFKMLSVWPLWLLHGLGWCLGWVVFGVSGVYRRRFLANARQAGLVASQWLGAVGENGKMVAELPRLWLGPAVPMTANGLAYVQAALAQGRGVVFLCPHLGCFEITGQAYAQVFGQQHPLTALFRPSRHAWLDEVVRKGRLRPGLLGAPATLPGVRQLIKALKKGDGVGLLPDQVPALGMGVWAPFFGQSAYTMTLSARLIAQTGAQVLLAWGERLPWGQGYRVHFSPLESDLPADLGLAAGVINAAMEDLIRQCPQQYLWGYARYKQPRGEPAQQGKA